VIFEVPAAVAEHVARWRGGEPAAPRDAATVVLLRDTPAGPEVFLLRRLRALAAFGGMTAFPGGSVDPADHTTGLEPPPWAAELGGPPDVAATLGRAAVRELREETGVIVPADRIKPWAHWITPIQEPRRYDTRFFVAAMPDGQSTVEHTGEAERVWWARPADALAARERGDIVMVPPTALTLAELAEFATVADVLAAPRRIRPLLPRLVAEGDRVRFELPA
jgi:8-oxo-dGTP pyrophosphatase MutT (NUDIX family)